MPNETKKDVVAIYAQRLLKTKKKDVKKCNFWAKQLYYAMKHKEIAARIPQS